jgi:hypothetical protein
VAQRFNAAINLSCLRKALQFAEKHQFVSGHRFSDAVTATESMTPLGAEVTGPSFSADCLASEVSYASG